MKKLITTLIFGVFITVCAFAQTGPTQFAVYEDKVNPSMDALYKATLKKLKSACEQHKVSFSYTSVAYDDNSYIHLVPIKGFADLDKNMLADLETKMGKDALSSIFADFDKCTESSTSFVVSMLPNMSLQSPPVGENFRDVLFWEYQPGKGEEAEKIIMEWKALYESKKAVLGFITYKVLLGREPGYAFVSWGKNELDHATKSQKNNELFGEEAGKLWTKTLAITKKYYSKRAWVLADHSHALTVATN